MKCPSVSFAVKMIILALCVLPFNTVQAEESGEVGFDVKAILPDNQMDKGQTFFDLRMKPDQTQTISVLINNTSAQECTYEVEVNQAYTNNQGFIDYTSKMPENQATIPYKINDIASYDNEITIAGNASEIIKITLEMPKNSFDGQILSSILITKKEPEQEKEQISNVVSYVLGLKLTETDTIVPREVSLLSVTPNVAFGKPSVIALLENPTMDAIGHIKYQAKIFDKKTSTLFYETTYDSDMELAPNSTFPLAIEMHDQKIEAGNYWLDLEASDAKGNTWSFKEDFNVSKKKAKEINTLTIDKVNKKTNNFALLTILLLIALSLFLIPKIIKKARNLKHE